MKLQTNVPAITKSIIVSDPTWPYSWPDSRKLQPIGTSCTILKMFRKNENQTVVMFTDAQNQPSYASVYRSQLHWNGKH